MFFHSTFPARRISDRAKERSGGARLPTSVSGEASPLARPLAPSLSPRCRVSQPEQNQLERWQPRCTCNMIVPVMKSAPAPRGELRRVFWHADLQIYKSAAPPGLNHRLDGASAAWRPRRVANCAKKKKRIFCHSLVGLESFSYSCACFYHPELRWVFFCVYFNFFSHGERENVSPVSPEGPKH